MQSPQAFLNTFKTFLMRMLIALHAAGMKNQDQES